MRRETFLVSLVIYVSVVFALMISSFHSGNIYVAVVSCWLASPMPMAVAAMIIEKRSLTQVANPRLGSWAFLFGDSFFLPFMAVMLALGWRNLNQTGTVWYTSWWWVSLCILLGLAAGLGFHTLDSANYTTLALNSPTKLVHDFVAYPVLFGGLVFALLPVLLNDASRLHGMVSLVGFFLWLAAGARDVIYKLDPEDLHVEYSWRRF